MTNAPDQATRGFHGVCKLAAVEQKDMMSESVHGASSNLEEPLSTLQCPYCLQYIPQRVVEKLRAVGIGPSVDCPSEDCDGYMRYRLGKDGRWAIQLQERSTR